MNYDVLTQHGIDYQSGLARCLGDEQFYEQLLLLFLEDDCFARAKAAYARFEQRELFKCLHELKGVSGNTAMTELYEAVCPLVELLRAKDAAPDEIAPLFAEIETAYRHTCEGVSMATAR